MDYPCRSCSRDSDQTHLGMRLGDAVEGVVEAQDISCLRLCDIAQRKRQDGYRRQTQPHREFSDEQRDQPATPANCVRLRSEVGRPRGRRSVRIPPIARAARLPSWARSLPCRTAPAARRCGYSNRCSPETDSSLQRESRHRCPLRLQLACDRLPGIADLALDREHRPHQHAGHQQGQHEEPKHGRH